MPRPRATVDIGVERAGADWAPVAVSAAAHDVAAALSLVFVDGVRRIDARVWIVDGESCGPACAHRLRPGPCTAWRRSATVIEPTVARGLYAMASATAGPIVTRHGTYELVPCAGDDAEALYLGIHERMTALETGLSVVGEADCVVYDGPLRGRNDPVGVGFVKTQAVQYLPDDQQRVLATTRRRGSGRRCS